MNRATAGLLCAGAALAIGPPAFACAVVLPPDYAGSNQEWQDVRRAISAAPLIVDGEVERPFIAGKQNALVRVHRVLKGTSVATIEVGAADSCSLQLTQLGERRRMILSAGPAVYQLYRDGSAARIEDHILRSDRRKVWPYVAGQEASN